MNEPCKKAFAALIRAGLPVLQSARTGLPLLSRVSAIRTERGVKYVDDTEPNWWQLPDTVRAALYGSAHGVKLENLIVETEPFSSVLGGSVVLPGTTISYDTPTSVVRTLLVSYLFAADCLRWKPSVSDALWRDAAEYFNPEARTLSYAVFAPVAGLAGIPRSLRLDADLSLRRLPVPELNRLGSRKADLLRTARRFRTRLFLVGTALLPKKVAPRTLPLTGGDGPFDAFDLLSAGLPYDDWVARINEELFCLRSFLSEDISIPDLEIVYTGLVQGLDGGVLPPTLPWHRKVLSSFQALEPTELNRYRRLRDRFKDRHGVPGWPDVAASMRRFSLAWENPAPADALADIVAALEKLIVGNDKEEVSYKLRIRTANLLTSNHNRYREIVRELSDAYGLRSGVAHGDYAPDTILEITAAKRLKRKRKGKKKEHPIETVNRVRRLTTAVTSHYRSALESVLGTDTLTIDWSERGL